MSRTILYHDHCQQGEVTRGIFTFVLQLLWELELVVSKLMNVRVPYEVFIARWKRLATCFVDTTENRSDDCTALDALKKIHEPFSPMGPLLLTLSEGQKMESFLKNVPSKAPYLVYTGADKSAGSEEQIFLIIDEDVLLECTQVSKSLSFYFISFNIDGNLLFL